MPPAGAMSANLPYAGRVACLDGQGRSVPPPYGHCHRRRLPEREREPLRPRVSGRATRTRQLIARRRGALEDQNKPSVRPPRDRRRKVHIQPHSHEVVNEWVRQQHSAAPRAGVAGPASGGRLERRMAAGLRELEPATAAHYGIPVYVTRPTALKREDVRYYVGSRSSPSARARVRARQRRIALPSARAGSRSWRRCSRPRCLADLRAQLPARARRGRGSSSPSSRGDIAVEAPRSVASRW